MKAMVLAAGRGTRLGALTITRPKALVEVGGVPLLEIVLGRLRQAGVTEVVINLHHLGEQIVRFLQERDHLGMVVHYSWEPQLLDTGGGLKQAARWLVGTEDEAILIHNVDVLSDIDLAELVRSHRVSGALASLAVKPRDTSRPLLFDDQGWLCGRITAEGPRIAREPVGRVVPLGFSGVHAISSSLLSLLSESGPFSIVDSYLRLAAEGRPIRAFRVDHHRWRDAGRVADLRPLDDDVCG